MLAILPGAVQQSFLVITGPLASRFPPEYYTESPHYYLYTVMMEDLPLISPPPLFLPGMVRVSYHQDDAFLTSFLSSSYSHLPSPFGQGGEKIGRGGARRSPSQPSVDE